ncbi:MAG: sodium-dependent transporter [Oscillospiraceae bacterium]|nr:sodium-dependent transporter [Oscillospiraceae bacterium]
MNNQRERLGSRLGFILLSAGCAIGCGNVWKFPWMTGQFGGGGFVLVYVLCLILLGLPSMIMEFAMGRASQASPVRMYQKLEKPGNKWHIHGYFALLGNIALMAFYTVVTGWMIYYFVRFLIGKTADMGFVGMITNPGVNVLYLAIAVVLGFLILSFGLQKGLERVTKYMMTALFILMIALAIHSATLKGAGEGIRFYLVPDFSKINGKVVVGAMNQAFFTLSIGIGSMAIFGSYIGKDRSLMGESVSIIALDTFVAIMAGFIMFPACFTYGIEVNAGPSLLFDTMATVFNNMTGGRIWGTLFFLFMVFAAFSTELAVFENILACVRELTGWSRKKGCLICGIGIFILGLTTALGYSVFHFQPFKEGTAWLDFWDFIVSTNLLPIGALIFSLFCCYKIGWGWDQFIAEANAGKGMKVKNWMKPIFKYVVPICVLGLYIYGLATFGWK